MSQDREPFPNPDLFPSAPPSRELLASTLRAFVRRVEDGSMGPSSDDVVVEEPFEMRYGGRSVSVVMRTPGNDDDLLVGHLFAEGWIDRASDVSTLRFAKDERDPEGPPSMLANVLECVPSGDASPPRERPARAETVTSSCGVCGKLSIEDALTFLHPPDPAENAGANDGRAWIVPGVLSALPDSLRAGQTLFHSTGALHAAGLFDEAGALDLVREDIGRHNAVDKVVGRSVLDGTVPLSDRILLVSGRVSFEIIQKAYRAGVPCVAAISGVSSLAIEFAARAGMTLVGFLRGATFVVYSGSHRIASE